MNVKLHTPSTLKSGSGMSSAKQFFLSLIATTVSIILTFGTAAVIDNQKKNASKKEMVMMVISDMDNTIGLLEKVDSGLCECRRLQMELAVHPEYYDSLRFSFAPAMSCNLDEFSGTIENIFSSSIETFNTIGDVNFVNEVSSFYLRRHQYKEMVIDSLKEDLEKHPIMKSLKELMKVSFPEYVLMNYSCLEQIRAFRYRCMKMMNVSEEDLYDFSKQHQNIERKDPESEALFEKTIQEYDSCTNVIYQARKKLGD